MITKLEREALKKWNESGLDLDLWVQLLNWPECPLVDLEGLRSCVRSLTWPDPGSPLDLPGFETRARRLRYQALGDECRKQDLRALLLAHHSDDQAETLFMRLASGHHGLGLHGMSQTSEIPECWGMHGVHRSGRMESAASRLRREENIDGSSLRAQALRRLLAQPDICERGGVTIIRPLLDFSKERLTETCRAQALQWEEDMTNHDIWRTPRNNIRELLHSAKLPQALRKWSMLQLAERNQNHTGMLKRVVFETMERCEILLLDVRCGGLIVRFVHRSKTKKEGRSTNFMKNWRLVNLLLLHRFARIVTPQEEVPLPSLEHAARTIFPDLADSDSIDNGSFSPTSFTAGGVQFQRLHSPLASPQSELDPERNVLDPLFVWKLTRQPFTKAPLSLTVQPSAKTESAVEESSSCWSSWQLWDGRYWIRLLNRSCHFLSVRSFQVSDLHYLQSILSRQRYKEFHQYLRGAAPGKVRWTLPAIAEIRDDSVPMGRLLALPTLGQAGAFATGDTDGTNKVEWQIRYKRVVTPSSLRSDNGRKIGRGRNKKIITSWQD